MPNKVEAYVPWRILLWCHNRLQDVVLGGGYNTQPLVTLDYEAYRQSSVTCAVLVEIDQMAIAQNDIGDGTTGATRATPEVTIVVHGSAKYGAGHPQMTILSLLQDVQTALSADVKSMRTTIGTGLTMRMGSVNVSTTALSAKKEAIFRLEVTFSYQQGSTW